VGQHFLAPLPLRENHGLQSAGPHWVGKIPPGPDPIVKSVILCDWSKTSLPRRHHPTLLPGENIERYQMKRRSTLCDISTNSAIKWLLAVDVAGLSREIGS